LSIGTRFWIGDFSGKTNYLTFPYISEIPTPLKSERVGIFILYDKPLKYNDLR